MSYVFPRLSAVKPSASMAARLPGVNHAPI